MLDALEGLRQALDGRYIIDRVIGQRGTTALTVITVLVAGTWRSARAQCPDGSLPPCRVASPSIDSTRYVVLPFAHRQGSSAAGLDGADCAELLSEAFARWSDVRVADRARVYDALERHEARSPFRIPLGAGLAIARQLGAGKLVMGQVWGFRDTVRLTAAVYEVAQSGRTLREVTTRIAATADDIGPAFNVLADSLLDAQLGTAPGVGAELTRSLRALRAHNLGDRAIREWDLARAARAFRAAVEADSEFAQAYLWLGQALLWAADSSPEATRDRQITAGRTEALLPRLNPRDRPLLRAQQAMFERRWPDACREYDAILASDSTSFAGWYGLAECHARDKTLLPYRRDTKRLTFRGSYEAALQAYRRALLLVPAFNLTFAGRAAERLPRLLLTERWYARTGALDGVAYHALPELDADTLAFFPVPAAVWPQHAEPLTHRAAVARNRARLSEIATAFVNAFPREPDAHRVLARALEMDGALVPAVGAPRSALEELAAAQHLERLRTAASLDAADRVRVLLKAGDFAAARALGDSLLATIGRPTPGVSGVAVLLGRPALAARLLAPADTEGLAESADGVLVPVPEAAAHAGLVLLAYAAVGAPSDSIVAYERRVGDLITSLPPAARASAGSALFDVPAELAFDAMGSRPAHRETPPGPHPRMHQQWALAHGNISRLRIELDSMRRARGGWMSTGESTPDGAYLDARLLLAVGDSAAAIRTLDAPLDSLVGLHSWTLRYAPLAGCLVRMMALRATLAAARGDPDAARHWGRAVVSLWSGAEAWLQPTVARMRSIVDGAR